MRTFSIGLAVAVAAMLALTPQQSFAGGKKNSSSSMSQHTVKGEHFKEATITARKKSQSKGTSHSDITITKPVDKSSP